MLLLRSACIQSFEFGRPQPLPGITVICLMLFGKFSLQQWKTSTAARLNWVVICRMHNTEGSSSCRWFWLISLSFMMIVHEWFTHLSLVQDFPVSVVSNEIQRYFSFGYYSGFASLTIRWKSILNLLMLSSAKRNILFGICLTYNQVEIYFESAYAKFCKAKYFP